MWIVWSLETRRNLSVIGTDNRKDVIARTAPPPHCTSDRRPGEGFPFNFVGNARRPETGKSPSASEAGLDSFTSRPTLIVSPAPLTNRTTTSKKVQRTLKPPLSPHLTQV